MTRYDIVLGKMPDAKIPNGDVYAKIPDGNIYKQSGGIGDFVDQTTCAWNEILAAIPRTGIKRNRYEILKNSVKSRLFERRALKL
jgi:hypothetical protein